MANAGRDGEGRVQDLLREVDSLMGELLREYEPDTETRNALTGDGGIASQDRGVQGDQQFAGRKTIPIKPVFNQGLVLLKDRIELTAEGKKFCNETNSSPTRQVFNCK